MGKKGKKGKGKGKDKKKGDDGEEEEKKPIDNKELIAKELELQTTRERMVKMEDEMQGMAGDNKELKLKLDQQRADQADIYYYLHKKLDDNYDVIAGLEKKLMELKLERQEILFFLTHLKLLIF